MVDYPINSCGAESLAKAIIYEAVNDWMSLIDKGHTDETTKEFNKLREFFKSDWCKMLVHGVDPEVILERLEKELRMKDMMKY